MNNDQTVQCQQEVNMSTSRYMHRECGVAISGATTVYRLVRWFTVDRLANYEFQLWCSCRRIFSTSTHQSCRSGKQHSRDDMISSSLQGCFFPADKYMFLGLEGIEIFLPLEESVFYRC